MEALSLIGGLLFLLIGLTSPIWFTYISYIIIYKFNFKKVNKAMDETEWCGD